MHETTRKALQFALKRETDRAARQWLRLMLRGEPPEKRRRRRRRRQLG